MSPLLRSPSAERIFRGSAGVVTARVAAAAGLASVVIFVGLVASSALGAVLLYRYVDLGSLGPLPDMHEPVWYPEKTVSAIAEGVAAGVLLVTVARTVHRDSAGHRRQRCRTARD
ncbi:MAG: hypothetical protein ACRDRU_15170 [Pseudonocardiaceae bacterium]